MRVGFNPNKGKQQTKTNCFHHVIIPVHIPNEEGYFEYSYEILKNCLDSLVKTAHSKTYISIIANGCCEKIEVYLNNLLSQEIINELIITTSIGKINSILKGIVGHSFSYITISDADVLFLNNWQSSTYGVFENFPKAGAVCPTPSSRSLRTFTANIYWNYFFSNKMKFTNVFNKKGLKFFAHSVGDDNFYNSVQLEKYLTISRKNFKAVVGAGHFVTTYRKEIFNNLETLHSNYNLGGSSIGDFLDIPVVKKGFWRLSTLDNYAYHMGNVPEKWMQVEINKLEVNNDEVLPIQLNSRRKNSKFINFIKNKIFGKFILNKKLMPYFLMYKGLSKSEAKEYLT